MERKANDTSLGPSPVKERRRYAKPRILSCETLEVLAATCTQPTSKPDPILCPSGPPQS